MLIAVVTVEAMKRSWLWDTGHQGCEALQYQSSLNERQALIKTEDRLSRNLDDVDFTGGLNREICRLKESKVLEEMVIAIDLGDIRKRYASKMEYLCGIRDGSKRELGNGYRL